MTITSKQSSTRRAEPGRIRALALDLDGTILGPGAVLSDRTIRAVKACAERGIQAIIATGRAILSAEPYRLALGLEGPMIYFNGAIVADPGKGTYLSTTLLDLKAAEVCLALSRELGVYNQVFFPGFEGRPEIHFITEKDREEREQYFKRAAIRAELGNLEEALARPGLPGCVKSMFLAEPEICAVIRSRLEAQLGSSVYIAQTQRNFLEVMDAQVSKGYGLKKVMDFHSLVPEEVLAFGDEENDLPMFQAAGFSLAPLSAKEEVKAAADHLIGSHEEEGAAAFLEEFFSL
ncbi:MAG: Cof-type HAD-IIB family hydrolase [Treponema sp.]|nr:Cof-type HAD-IIB family hydrolase [Treponema sp.]